MARMRRSYRDGSLAFRLLTDDPCALSAAAGSSRTFVLVHGLGTSHRYLTRLHDALAATATVVSIDLPGHAGVPTPQMDVDVRAMATGLAGAIASLGTGPVVLIGHSMGTQWITAVARDSPRLVDRLVLIAPVADAQRRSLPAQALALARDSLGESPRINAIVFSDYARCGVRWHLAQARHMVDFALEEEVAHVDVPVLVIRGARDPIASARWCRMVRDRAQSAHLIEVDGHHHVVQHSASHEVASAITAFVTGAAPSVATTP